MITNEALVLQALQTVKQFYRHLDSQEIDKVVELLADDIRWHRPGGWVEGIEQAAAALEHRTPDMIIRHLVLNDVADIVSENEVEVRYCIVSFSTNDASLGPTPETPTPSIFDCVDKLRLVDDTLKFTFRSPSAVFLRPGLADNYAK